VAFKVLPADTDVTSKVESSEPRLSTHVMILRSLVLVCLLFGALIPTSTSSVQSASALIALPLIAWEFVRLPKRATSMLKFVLPVFVAFLVGALINPPSSEYGQAKVLSFLTATLVTAMAACIVRTRTHCLVFLRVWLIAGLALALVTALGAVGTGSYADRAIGLGSNPIWLARPIASSILVLAWLFLRREIGAIATALAGSLLILALIDTGSRGPLLAAIVGLIVLCAVEFRRKPMQTTLFVLSGLILYTLYLVLSSSHQSRLGLVLADPSHLADATRSQAFRSTIKLIAHRPSGVGWGNWSSEVQVRSLQYPHNVWLEWAAEGGWAIASVFLFACVVIVVKLMRTAGKDSVHSICLALLACEILEASVSGSTIDNRTLFFLLSLSTLALGWPPGEPFGARPPRLWVGRSRTSPQGRIAYPHRDKDQ
jgi:hypothetical protein